MPGMFRYVLDSYFPSLHRWLTTEVGLFKLPPEWAALNGDLNRLSADILRDIRDKTYIEPPVRDVPEEAGRWKAKRKGVLTPIQQVIKELPGVSRGGDAQSAQISAISRKSKFVRNIVKRLLKAEEPLILLGDPGIGKTFTLRQAAMEVVKRESGRVFPKACLFVRMGRFQMSGKNGEKNVWDYVNMSRKEKEEAVWKHVEKFTGEEVRPYLKALAASKRLVIFFDGMDEMSHARYNDYTDALSLFAHSYKWRIKTLFSCRITDFTPTFQHYRLVILPFTWKRIRAYLKWQFRDSPIEIGGELWSAKSLAKWLAQDTLPIEATNPFVLRLLCEYIQKKHAWPQSRVHLLEYYAHSNYAEKAAAAARESRPMPDADDAFLTWGRIAYEVTKRNMGTEIPRPDLEQFLTPKELPGVQAGKDCGVLIEAVDLEENEPALMRFEHHRFQEFFTAYHLDKNKAVTKSLPWLDLLDAPRWQETIFNLVLMNGADEALAALVKAVEQDLDCLDELKGPETSEDTEKPDPDAKESDNAKPADPEKSAEAARLETLLADRVELSSRILQQTRQQQQQGEGRDALLSTFQRAVNWLSEHGNPITRVKMLLAARIVPETDIWGITQKVRASKVSWVHQQARIISLATDRKVEASELQDKDPTIAIRGGVSLQLRFGPFPEPSLQLCNRR